MYWNIKVLANHIENNIIEYCQFVTQIFFFLFKIIDFVLIYISLVYLQKLNISLIISLLIFFLFNNLLKVSRFGFRVLINNI